MDRRFIALVLAAFMIVACQHVTVTFPSGVTAESRSFGAGSTTVESDGKITTTSPGLSEGFTGVMTYALTAVARFFHVGPAPAPTPVEITITAESTE